MMRLRSFIKPTGIVSVFGSLLLLPLQAEDQKTQYNVLFMIADDLTATALSCYENKACQTPNIDKLASAGTRFTHAYCQFPVCGPSRASFMSGYYPHATKTFGYTSGRKAIGAERATWSQHFKNHGYQATRVSKIFHMGVPGDIERGTNGADDVASWSERFNSQGPEVFCPGKAVLLQGNPDGTKKVRGGNTLEYNIAEGDDLVHSDGKTAAKAVELIAQYKNQPFFLAVGFVRPHVPFVAPAKYYDAYPFDRVQLPESVDGDWEDIPKAGINYRTSPGMQLDDRMKREGIGAYYASVSYMDAQLGKVMDALEKNGLSDNTIVIFTSDHGFHLNEHDFWMKVGLMEESSRVPLIIKVPGQKPAVCHSFAELLDLYPTVSELCGLPVPEHIQGKSLKPVFEDPTFSVRDFAFSVNGKSLLVRNKKWAYIQHGEDASLGMQLYDMENDPKQFTNLAQQEGFKATVAQLQGVLKAKLEEVRSNDLGIDYTPRKKKRKK
ncbi:sulfatase [Rubritalea tangerina]|uniref:Sulfatase n=1 Tax=Rubritalea tangerina TaxID=430798 RepID=A0ABW4Z6N1_9BACT